VNVYVFIDDLGDWREEVIKIQAKVALGFTSILLGAIKSSLRAGKGVGGGNGVNVRANISFMASREILQMYITYFRQKKKFYEKYREKNYNRNKIFFKL
jgi:hypothetical protein